MRQHERKADVFECWRMDESKCRLQSLDRLMIPELPQNRPAAPSPSTAPTLGFAPAIPVLLSSETSGFIGYKISNIRTNFKKKTKV